MQVPSQKVIPAYVLKIARHRDGDRRKIEQTLGVTPYTLRERPARFLGAHEN